MWAVAIAFQPSFDDLSTPLFDVTFCVLDLETTGATPADCEITEIGAVKYKGGELLGSFQILVEGRLVKRGRSMAWTEARALADGKVTTLARITKTILPARDPAGGGSG